MAHNNSQPMHDAAPTGHFSRHELSVVPGPASRRRAMVTGAADFVAAVRPRRFPTIDNVTYMTGAAALNEQAVERPAEPPKPVDPEANFLADEIPTAKYDGVPYEEKPQDELALRRAAKLRATISSTVSRFADNAYGSSADDEVISVTQANEVGFGRTEASDQEAYAIALSHMSNENSPADVQVAQPASPSAWAQSVERQQMEADALAQAYAAQEEYKAQQEAERLQSFNNRPHMDVAA